MLRQRYPHGHRGRTYIHLHAGAWDIYVLTKLFPKWKQSHAQNHAEMQGVGAEYPTGGEGGGGGIDRSFFVFLKPFIEDHFPTHHF